MDQPIHSALRALLCTVILMVVLGIALVLRVPLSASIEPPINEPNGVKPADAPDTATVASGAVRSADSVEDVRPAVRRGTRDRKHIGLLPVSPVTLTGIDDGSQTRTVQSVKNVPDPISVEDEVFGPPNPRVRNSDQRNPFSEQRTSELTDPGESVSAWEADRVFRDSAEQPFAPMQSSRRISFNPITQSRSWPNDSRLESRLAMMERKLDQIVTRQTSRHSEQLENKSQFDHIQQRVQILQQLQQASQLQNLERQMQQLLLAQVEPNRQDTNRTVPLPVAISDKSTAVDAAVEPPATGRILKTQPTEGNSERFSMQIQETEIREVLEMLGQLSGLNILTGSGVAGQVSANLNDVTVDEALTAILRSLDLTYERDGNFIHVTTDEAVAKKRASERKLITKVYRPNYINVKELQSLIMPVLTAIVGKIGVTTPSATGIEQDGLTEGDGLSQADMIVVLDYPEVIKQVDEIIKYVDVPPLQVVIEAKILSVQLTDSMKFGVNFALLSGSGDDFAVLGDGQALSGSSGFPTNANNPLIGQVGEFVSEVAGFKYGLIRGNVSSFISALESVADTNLIAAPQLRVLNKQKAELLIGKKLSYTTTTFNGTQSQQSVNFLEVGTKLVLRPFISSDGLIRMEVHPERSDGFINASGLPDTTTTEVTTNVMCRDGATVVIGGLIEETVTDGVVRVPWLGSIPVLGGMFRNKSDSTVRSELIILLTTRIVNDEEAEKEGDVLNTENERRAAHFRDNLAPFNRYNLARLERERAQFYFDRGEFLQAHYHVKRALRQSRNDQTASRLRDKIESELELNSRKWLFWPSGLKRRSKTRKTNSRSGASSTDAFERPYVVPLAPPAESLNKLSAAEGSTTEKPAASAYGSVWKYRKRLG